jgi:hypothetical protein
MTADTGPAEPTTAERERFDALAPFAGSATLSSEDTAWLATFTARHPALAAELAQHRALRQALRAQWSALPDDVGWARAQAQVRALARHGERPAAVGTAPGSSATGAGLSPGWLERLRGWLQPSPVWALASLLLALPLGFMVGREAAPPPYADVRGSGAPGLFDGPLLRLNFKPDTPEHAVRELVQAQGALLVGPTRLGDWYAKVAPARVAAVRAALARDPALASVDVVPALPAELLDTP